MNTYQLKSFYGFFDIAIEVAFRQDSTHFTLEYKLSGKDLSQIAALVECESSPRNPPQQASELWKTTCFEFFLFSENTPNYYEYNFAGTSWDRMFFEDFRKKGTPNTSEPATINSLSLKRLNEELLYTAKLAAPTGVFHLSPTVILEHRDGRQDFYALKHGVEKPDFHRLPLVKDLTHLLRFPSNDKQRN